MTRQSPERQMEWHCDDMTWVHRRTAFAGNDTLVIIVRYFHSLFIFAPFGLVLCALESDCRGLFIRIYIAFT
jgi:hypothetical protein